MSDTVKLQREIETLQARLVELTQRQTAPTSDSRIDKVALLGQVMDLVPHEIFAKDDQGNFVVSNRAHAASYGLTPPEVVGCNERQLSEVSSEVDKFLEDDLEIIHSQRPKFIPEEVFTDTSGEQHVLQTHKIPFQIVGSQRPGVLGVAVDITARKHAEQGLKASEERFRVMADNAPIGIATLDVQGALNYANPEFVRLTGLTREPSPGTNWTHGLHPDDEPRVLREWHQSLAAGETFHSEHRYGHAEESTRWARVTTLPLRDDEDLITGWLCLALDLTQQVESQATLDERQQLLARVAKMSTMGKLATGLAHEVNQPLAAISSYALAGEQLLQNNPHTPPAEIQELFGKMGAQAVRAGDIIKRLRNFIGKQTVVRQSIHVLEPIHEVLALFEASFRRHGIQVELQSEPTVGQVLIDKVQVQQVFVNLIRNALDALQESPPNHRRLTISLEAFPTHVQIAVRDEGPGIQPQHLEQLFDAFYTTKEDALGMGLAISRSIVEAHEGKLWLHENPDRGVTFFLTLPRPQPESPEFLRAENRLIG